MCCATLLQSVHSVYSKVAVQGELACSINLAARQYWSRRATPLGAFRGCKLSVLSGCRVAVDRYGDVTNRRIGMFSNRFKRTVVAVMAGIALSFVGASAASASGVDTMDECNPTPCGTCFCISE